ALVLRTLQGRTSPSKPRLTTRRIQEVPIKVSEGLRRRDTEPGRIMMEVITLARR
ncbi:hypothetical protein Pmani_035611, partial [Petrolisthes manimaculis]